MNEAALLQNYLIVGALLFCVGLIGLVTRRNLIIMFLAVEMMLQGVSLSLVAWGRYYNDWGAQLLVIFVIIVAACEAAIALALILVLYRASGSLDAAVWQHLREEEVTSGVEPLLAEEPSEKPAWPRLVPAGVEPEHMPDKDEYRSHV